MAPPQSDPQHGNLPLELSSFVGRRQQLAEVKRALASTRLLTLTGVGGVGKTKLALRAGRESARLYPGGVWLVELAPVRDPRLVVQAVFAALGLRDEASAAATATLAAYLRDRRQLLILDNCEHVRDAAAELAGALLRACGGLRIFATSRQALGVTGEVVVDVPTLSLPRAGATSVAALLESDAAVLFAERAAAVQPGFQIDSANAAAIASICSHLDGIPLALELAAVRLHALGLEGLDRGIRTHLGYLGRGDGSVAPRQQTLEAAIEWSYRLLSEDERRLWARLSVFGGGFELDAAVAVCGDGEAAGTAVPMRLAALVEKSVLKRGRDPGPGRFRLLEPMRQFGLQKLRESGTEQVFRARHRDWVAGIAAIAGASDHRQVEAFERVRLERANLWAALDFCLGDPAEAESGAAICCDLWIYWASQGPASDALRTYRAFIDRLAEPTRPRGRLLWVAALAAASLGDLGAAARWALEGLEIGRATQDPEVVAWSLQALGVGAYLAKRWDEAVARATEARDLAQTMGSRFTTLSATVLIGVARTYRGELDAGIAIAQAGLRLSEDLGETWERAYLYHFLSVAMLKRGDPAEADANARRSLELKRALGDVIGMASGLETLAVIAVERGSSERVATLLGAGTGLWRSVPAEILAPYRADHDRAEAAARGTLGTARFEAAFEAGLRMTRDEAVEYALGIGRPGTVAASESGAGGIGADPADGPLSRRQMEVAELVADGATNAQVAARLFISERTVESHLAGIFNKLGVDSRTQLARWVAGTGDASHR